MVSLSVRVWPLIVDAVAESWAVEVEALRPVRQVTLAHDGIRVLVAGSPVGSRMDAAWSLCTALVEVMADPAFTGVPATITVDGLVAAVPADTITALVDGCDRSQWAAGIEVRVGQAVDPT